MASIVANPKLDPDAEATRLFYAMKGKGYNEDEIIKILTSNNEIQREKIKYAFMQTYGEDLVEVLKKELKGKLEDMVLGLVVPRRQFVVQEIKKAFKGMGANENALMDLLIPCSNAELVEIIELYKNVYGKELADEVRKELKGSVRDVFVAILAADRDLGRNDSKIANRSQELKAAVYDTKWSDDSPFIYIFNKSSFDDLKQICEVFQSLTGQDLETIIRAKTKGDFEELLIAIVRAAKSIPAYYAERLNDAMAGRGCDDKTLIRILLLRAEIDMLKIKDEYKKKFGRSLDEAIKSETKGEYQKMALALIN